MFLDLVGQELVERRARFGVGREDSDDAASGGLLELVGDLRLQPLHHRGPGRHFAVGHEGLLEIAPTECTGDLLEMGANLVAARPIGRILDVHRNRATVLRQSKMVRGLVLIEAHGQVAVALHLGFLLHLRHVLGVAHAWGHGCVLGVDRWRKEQADECDEDCRAKRHSHDHILDPGTVPESSGTPTFTIGGKVSVPALPWNDSGIHNGGMERSRTRASIVPIAGERRTLLNPSELARLTGVSTDTLRHYERKRVLAIPARSQSGYRRYPPEAVAHVRLVRRALAIGFTLNDLAAVLSERDGGGAPCRRVRTLVAERLAELETRLRDLSELRDELKVLLREWDRRLARIPAGAQARLLDVLAGRPGVDRAVARQRRDVSAANPRRRPLARR
jgi:MerR family transcriptional regulator, copper efflux regulator